MSFCITLAALLENKDAAKGLVEKLEKPERDAGTLVLLHEQLSSLELAHLLTPSLVNSDDPQVLYLAHLALRDQGKQAEADDSWEKVFVPGDSHGFSVARGGVWFGWSGPVWEVAGRRGMAGGGGVGVGGGFATVGGAGFPLVAGFRCRGTPGAGVKVQG